MLTSFTGKVTKWVQIHKYLKLLLLRKFKIILNNALDVAKGSSDINSALKYFNSITDYMMQLRTALGELRDDIEYKF